MPARIAAARWNGSGSWMPTGGKSPELSPRAAVFLAIPQKNYTLTVYALEAAASNRLGATCEALQGLEALRHGSF